MFKKGSSTPTDLSASAQADRNLFKRILDDSADGFFIIDNRYRIIHCNKSFSGMFRDAGLEAGEVPVSDIMRGRSKRNFRDKVHLVFRRRRSEMVEIKIAREDINRHYLITLTPVRDDSEDVRHVCGFVTDITEIKNLQHQLENERNYNRGIIETVNLGFVFINDNNEYMDFNNEYLAILGRRKEDLEGKTFYEFTAPAYVADQKMLTSQMNRTGRPYVLEKEVVRKDGSTVPVLVSMSRLVDKENKVLGNFAFIRDISEQKRIERELIEQNKKTIVLIDIYNAVSGRFIRCETTDEVFEALSESIGKLLKPDSLEILHRASGGFRSVFAEKKVTRKDNQRIDGKVSLIVNKLVERQAPVLVRDIRNELNDEDFEAFPGLSYYKSGIFIPILAAGSVTSIIILSFKSFLSGPDDGVMDILVGISSLASITIEKILSVNEHKLMKSALDRYERLTFMGRIIAGVAHEINNPLSIMQLDVDELKTLCRCEGQAQADAFNELAQSIQEEISRLSSIVKQLKDYSNPSIEASEDVCVDDLLKVYPVRIFLKNIQKKGISVRLDLKAGGTAIRISKNRLMQVLMNLFANADDAIEEKSSGEIVIETGRISTDRRLVYISIEDNGEGIPEENLDRIFEPFFTTKKKEGTGLGLPISYSIIKSYDGEIHVNSSEGKGTRITLHFPEVEPGYGD
jgi:PAS domain S-box-containing protein